MKSVSETYMLIENLYNAAKHHADTCQDSQCNVSVFRLKLAARKLLDRDRMLPNWEQDEIATWFCNWPN